MTSLFLSIAHASHRPEREPLLRRLLQTVGKPHPSVLGIHIESGEKPNLEWAMGQWKAAAESHGTHGLFLNDDVIPCEGFLDVVTSLVEAKPDKIISLHCNHPKAAEVYESGEHWYTSVDGLIGVAYVLPMPILSEFLNWRDVAMVPEARNTTSEDIQIDLFAMANGRDIWHTVPSPIDHDTSVPSTYGNDGHTNRRPVVGPMADMRSIDWTKGATSPLHVGRYFKCHHWRLITDLVPEHRCIEQAYQLERAP